MIDKLMISVLENTKKGNIIWKLKSSIFNSETKHSYHCFLNDGTELTADIELDDDLKYDILSLIRVNNKKLVDGHIYVHRNRDANVNEIGKLIYKMFLSKTLTPRLQSQDSVLGEILSCISKEQIIDDKISTIIGEKNTEEKVETTIKNTSTIEESLEVENKKTIWQKIKELL